MIFAKFLMHRTRLFHLRLRCILNERGIPIRTESGKGAFVIKWKSRVTGKENRGFLFRFCLICCNFAKVFIGVAVLAAMKRESGANPEQNPLL